MMHFANSPVGRRSLDTVRQAPALPRLVLRGAFGALLALFGLYAAAFIYRTSFVVNGERYFSLFDDAMISMRYARNLASGHGLVCNAGGPRVEGFTAPAWVFYMAVLHLVSIAPSKMSVLVQITAAASLLLNLILVRRIALRVTGGDEAVAYGAMVLTASYLPLNHWSLQGMEVSVLVTMTSLSIWLALRSADEPGALPWLCAVLAGTTLVRLDMVVLCAAIAAFLLWTSPGHQRGYVAVIAAVALLSIALQTVGRLWYFGELAPNTYYDKLAGFPMALRVTRGLYVLLQFVWKFNILLAALTAWFVLRCDRRMVLLLLVFSAQCAYSVWVGGDAWEYWGGANRFIVIAMPGIFIACAAALRRVSQSGLPRPGSRASTAVYVFLLVLALANVNAIRGPAAWREAILLEPPLHSGPGGENAEDVTQALALRQITTPDATLTVARAGTLPYFAERPSVDLLGKTDRHVAHEPMRSLASGAARLIEFRPGHMKFDYAYSIGQLRPDVIAQLWSHVDDEVWSDIRSNYRPAFIAGRCVYLKPRSTRILWEHVRDAACPQDRRDDERASGEGPESIPRGREHHD